LSEIREILVIVSHRAARAWARHSLKREGSGMVQEQLTPREIEVLKLIAGSISGKEIAERLGIAFRTARSHRANLMEKLELHDTAALVRYAIRNGLIQA
jgi:DNA-binding NarL/FixJ family response regulator